jgi:hypothetical protein
MSAHDTEQVVRMLEAAIHNALAGGMVGVVIVLTDEDGREWPSRWRPVPSDEPRVVRPVARVQ